MAKVAANQARDTAMKRSAIFDNHFRFVCLSVVTARGRALLEPAKRHREMNCGKIEQKLTVRQGEDGVMIVGSRDNDTPAADDDVKILVH